jgi:hypothetical protein
VVGAFHLNAPPCGHRPPDCRMTQLRAHPAIAASAPASQAARQRP